MASKEGSLKRAEGGKKRVRSYEYFTAKEHPHYAESYRKEINVANKAISKDKKGPKQSKRSGECAWCDADLGPGRQTHYLTKNGSSCGGCYIRHKGEM